MAEVMGWAAALFYKVGGIAAGGSWVHALNLKDVTSGESATEVDATTRASLGYTWTQQGLKNNDLQFDVIYDTTDPFYLALATAYRTGAVIGIRVLDGAVAGSKGIQMDCQVFNLTSNEALGELVTKSVTLKPCRSATPPSEVTI